MAKIVKFEDGRYAIRKGNCIFGYKYKDLKINGYWWKNNSKYIEDCKTKNINELSIKTDYGKVVKIK